MILSCTRTASVPVLHPEQIWGYYYAAAGRGKHFLLSQQQPQFVYPSVIQAFKSETPFQT